MRVFYILVILAVFTSASPQHRAIFFPDDVNTQVDNDLDGNEPDVNTEVDNDIDDNEPDDVSYGYEEFDGEFYEGEDAYSELEDFGYEGEYVELPEWMDTDLDEMSLEKLAILNNLTEFSELSGFFGEGDLDAFFEQPELSVDSRSAIPSDSIAEKKEEDAKFAKCKPEKVTVEIPKTTKNTLYMPSCVRLMRCGGCCNSKLLSCQPTKVENVTLQVMKISKRGNTRGSSSRRGRRRRTSGQKVPMAMQNHVKCKCDCKTQEKDCDPQRHNYNKAACICECKNGEEEMECQKSSALHAWDKNLCSCMCRKEKECSTGEMFSQKTCRCVTANEDNS